MNNLILGNYEEIDYVLVARLKDNGEVYEYVCGWAPVFNESGELLRWGQGHYFSDIEYAVDYLREKGVK